MIRAGILGATGYTALELIKLLARHPEVEITTLTSRQEGNPHVAAVHPRLAGCIDLHLQNLEPLAVAAQADCIFSCLPHGASASAVAALIESDVKVIDFSADYRLWDADLYERWYGGRHPQPAMLKTIPYGLPELFRKEIQVANHVANPGCYPTSAILALAPLLRAQLVEGTDIIIDSKSGVSGAGRTPKLTAHYPECNESITAYNVGRHRHTPEILQILSHVANVSVSAIFTPHLVPMDRGILTTAYAHPAQEVSEEAIFAVFREFFAGEPFVRIVDHLPATKDTQGTNFCDITVRKVGDRVVVISCIDNLIKGASGAAVQNMNLLFELPETMGLEL